MWGNPASWFAAFVRLAAGDVPLTVWLASGLALAISLGCVPLAAGRLSLDYAQRLSETTVAGEPATRRRFRLPGFGQRGIAGRRPARRRAVPLRSALPHGHPRHRPADPVLSAARTESGRAGRSLLAGRSRVRRRAALHGRGVHADDPARVAQLQRLLAGCLDLLRHAGFRGAADRGCEEYRDDVVPRELSVAARGDLELLLRARYGTPSFTRP